jgi:polyferredoxin
MGEIGRPRGLIDYVTLEDSAREKAGEPPRPAWRALLRPRTIAYFTVWGCVGLAMLFALGARAHIGLSAAPDRNPPYMLMSNGSVRNAYTLKVRNMEDRPRAMRIALTGLPGAIMWTDEIDRSHAGRAITSVVAADATQPLRVYVVAPPNTEAQDFSFTVVTQDEQVESDTSQTRFSAPGDD